MAVITFEKQEKPHVRFQYVNSCPVHVISLNAGFEDWGEFIFQFSHEWTHHLLGAKLPESYKGLMWMEEIFCRIVSLETLDHFRNLNLFPDFPLPSFRNFLDNPSKQIAKCILPLENGIPPFWIDELNDQTKSADRLMAIAIHLSGIFFRQKSLFQIFAKAGRPVEYSSLDSYFLKLQSFSDPCSLEFLLKIKKFFMHSQ